MPTAAKAFVVSTMTCEAFARTLAAAEALLTAAMAATETVVALRPAKAAPCASAAVEAL